MDNIESLIGTTIAQYRIDRVIGQGGMSTVYLAYDLRLERPVALKLMNPLIASEPEFRERLKQEAQSAGRLDHPSIVKIFNFGETAAGQLYIAMEYIKDGSLFDHLRRVTQRNGRMDISLALQIGVQIAEALDHAHRLGSIHRDVKPGNIILKRLDRAEVAGFAPFRAVLTDFGLVQQLDRAFITQSGVTMGTPTYMSPEQCEARSLSAQSDLYSLGAVIYEALAGRPPLSVVSLQEAISMHVRGQTPPPVSSIREDVPRLLDQVLARALAKNPAERFVSGEAMAERLRIAYFSVAETPTRVWHSRRLTTDEATPLEMVQPPDGYVLVVETDGREGDPDRYIMDRSQYTFGRASDNDLVLVSEAVSRYHARVEYTSQGWVIRALPGINGTFLNGRRLKGDEPIKWQIGEPIRLGPYEMTLEGSGVQQEQQAERVRLEERVEPLSAVPVDTTPSIQAVTQATLMPASPPSNPQMQAEEAATAPFSLFIDRESVRVQPGETGELIVEVLNQSDRSDRVRLDVRGLPEDWVKITQGFQDVPADGRAAYSIQFDPPRDSSAEEGERTFHIDLFSQERRRNCATLEATLLLTPFTAFEARLSKEEFQLPETVKVLLTNRGNQTTTFSVLGREKDGPIKVLGEQGSVELAPGQTAEVPLALEWRRQGLLANDADLVPFEVMVRSAGGGTKVLAATALPKAANWRSVLAYGGCFLLAFLCSIPMMMFLFGNLSRGAPVENTPLPTVPLVTQLPTLTGGQVAATLDALTPISGEGEAGETGEQGGATAPTNPDGDSDNDGLTDAQESRLGSDPNLADTDGDTLLDGDEVIYRGTSPIKSDTDGDQLSDADEINAYKTAPDNWDTDGDGIGDRTEILNGSDPLVSDATATMEPATETPTVLIATETLTPIVVTATPTETPIPTETVAATVPAEVPTDVPTTEPTTEPTVVPTDEPTTEPTIEPTTEPTLEPTPTLTPTVEATLTATPTITPTLEPTVEPSPTVEPTTEPTPEPTVEATPSSVTQLICTSSPPALDGIVSETEKWQSVGSFTSPNAPSRFVDVSMMKDADYVYFAIEVTDSQATPLDSVRFFLDTTADGGAPDFQDRRMTIGQNGDLAIEAGNGETWDGTYLINDAQLSVTPTDWGWSAELRIGRDTDMPTLENPFLMMVQATLSNDVSQWPDTSAANNPATWQAMDNAAVCP